jgi:hypothetical protein
LREQCGYSRKENLLLRNRSHHDCQLSAKQLLLSICMYKSTYDMDLSVISVSSTSLECICVKRF